MERAIIAVPWYRERLDADERISLAHLRHHLGDREIVVVKPEGLSGTLDGRPVESFPDSCFQSVDTYTALLLSPAFYRRFARYEWLFIYQLDALALDAGLDVWLDAPWDYIGAPWPVDAAAPEQGFSRVGNGGFCLRRVDACLRVLEAGRAPRPAKELLRAPLPDLHHLPPVERFRKRLAVLREAARGVAWYTSRYTLNEDHFWADRAHLFGTGFTVAPVARGLAFAFEQLPRRAYELNGGALPFGAHAWQKHDREFWKPHLLTDPESRAGGPAA